MWQQESPSNWVLWVFKHHSNTMLQLDLGQLFAEHDEQSSEDLLLPNLLGGHFLLIVMKPNPSRCTWWTKNKKFRLTVLHNIPPGGSITLFPKISSRAKIRQRYSYAPKLHTPMQIVAERKLLLHWSWMFRKSPHPAWSETTSSGVASESTEWDKRRSRDRPQSRTGRRGAVLQRQFSLSSPIHVGHDEHLGGWSMHWSHTWYAASSFMGMTWVILCDMRWQTSTGHWVLQGVNLARLGLTWCLTTTLSIGLTSQ